MEGKGADETGSLYYWIILKVNRLTLFYEINRRESKGKYKSEYIEGYVFVDANGFMTKVKSGFYNEWKKLRGVADHTLRCGYVTKTGMLTNAVENLFYGFCKKLYNNDYDKDNKSYPYKTDIISLRNKFYLEENCIK